MEVIYGSNKIFKNFHRGKIFNRQTLLLEENTKIRFLYSLSFELLGKGVKCGGEGGLVGILRHY